MGAERAIHLDRRAAVSGNAVGKAEAVEIWPKTSWFTSLSSATRISIGTLAGVALTSRMAGVGPRSTVKAGPRVAAAGWPRAHTEPALPAVRAFWMTATSVPSSCAERAGLVRWAAMP